MEAIGMEEDFVNTANDLLIHQQFQDCIQVCEKGLLENCAGRIDMYSLQRKESLCVVALQAYAESNKWKDVQSFLELWYGDLSRLTPTLTKLSLLLYIKVGDIQSADSIAITWLEKNTSQCDAEEFKSVLRIYVKEVLLPNEMLDKAQALLHSCDILTEEEKQDLMHVNNPEQTEAASHDQPATSEEEVKSRAVVVLPSSPHPSSWACVRVLQKLYHKLHTLLLRLQQWVSSPGAQPYVRQLIRLLTLSLFIYSLLFMTDRAPGFYPGSGVSQLWNAFVHAWKSLFYPYHLAPLQ